MDRSKTAEWRSILFRHLDGLGLCAPIAALHEHGVLDVLRQQTSACIEDLSDQFNVNPGYLNVSLRLLASQGWLTQNILEDGQNTHYSVTAKGQACLALGEHYPPFARFISRLAAINDTLFDENPGAVQTEFDQLMGRLEALNTRYAERNTPGWEMTRHLEGLLAGPMLVALGMHNFSSKWVSDTGSLVDSARLEEYPMLRSALHLLTKINWLYGMEGRYCFTEEGLFFLKRASAYGVTVSYLPMFARISDLLFGDPAVLWYPSKDGLETHVNRRMNVWGSGGAHALYFKKIDEIITHIFNQPIEDQPTGIADMGCGDGTLLVHLYEVVKNQTERGKQLDRYPLRVIGADFNAAAREASGITLKKAGIDHAITYGDISDPAGYATCVRDQFGLDLKDMLNVRSFLDHNRIYSGIQSDAPDNSNLSSGAFCFRGQWIANQELQQNLVEHFQAWAPHIGNHGLLILELHTLAPELTAQHLGKSLSGAYDATHGFSDQYILEVECMLEAAEKAGLTADPHYQALFPNAQIPTISINLFRTLMH